MAMMLTEMLTVMTVEVMRWQLYVFPVLLSDLSLLTLLEDAVVQAMILMLAVMAMETFAYLEQISTVMKETMMMAIQGLDGPLFVS